MSTSRHERIAELFALVAELPPAERPARLDAALSEHPSAEGPSLDASLRADVLSLLAAHDGSSSALESPPAVLFEAVSPSRPALPERIGPYRILGLLGEGGMGVVYLAESDRPRRQVALKVIRALSPLWGGGDSVRRRFEQEAQVLAMLQHPGIAQVYDAGAADTPNGHTPYFAMELVRGMPLTEHASTHALGPRERIELLAKVCDAVQHAHERGVIHRDLKPANILVRAPREPSSTALSHTASSTHAGSTPADRLGQPTILDFGVARVTDRDQQLTTIATGVGQLVGTLAYMSPEQVAGDPDRIDARSDIYALGVILFELLTGRQPIDVRARSLPDAVRAIRDDDPAHLSSLNRALRGDLDTIVAKAIEKDPSRRYAAAADLAAELRRYLADQPIVARPPSTIYQFSKFARRNRGLVAGVAVALGVLLLSTVVLAFVAREAIAQRDLARAAEERNQLLAEEAQRERAAAQREAATVRKVNAFFNDMLVQAHPDLAQGRETTLADAAQRVESQIESAFADEPIIREELHQTLGRILAGQGRYADAAAHFQASVDLMAARLPADDRAFLESRGNLASSLQLAGRTAEAAAILEHDAELAASTSPDDPRRAIDLQRLVTIRRSQGRSAEAEALCRQALDLAVSEEDRLMIESLLMSIFMETGRMEQANAMADDLLPRARLVFSTNDPNYLSILQQCGQARGRVRRHALAEDLFRQCAEIAEKVYGKDHPTTHGYLDSIAGALSMQGKFDQAEPLIRAVIDGRRATLGPDHPNTIASLGNLGWMLNTAERPAEAEPILREVFDWHEKRHTLRHPSSLNTANNYGGALMKLERWAEADALYDRILAVADEVLPSTSAEPWRYRYCKARCDIALGRPALVLDVLEKVHEFARSLPRERNMARQSAERLAEAYDALGRPEDATKWRKASEEFAVIRDNK